MLRHTRSVLGTLVFFLVACGDGSSELPCPPPGRAACDPVEQRCCGSLELCIAYYSAGMYQDICREGQGEVAEGGACLIHELSGEHGCQAGLICLMIPGVDASANCHRLCLDDTDCIEGTCEHELNDFEPIKACVSR